MNRSRLFLAGIFSLIFLLIFKHGLEFATVAVTTVNFQYPKEPTADLQPSIDVYNQKEVRLVSAGPIESAASVTVKQRTLRISPDLTGVVEHLESITGKVETIGDNEVTVQLQDKLRGGTAYNLLIPVGLSDGTKPIKVNGTVKFPGGPAVPDTPKIDLFLSSGLRVSARTLNCPLA